ncbi:MAG: hypothetical protein K6A38_06530 [Lachnospiraceae bacterium]|nr:hypothetical protein [Lachnospiraceae bacterium]
MKTLKRGLLILSVASLLLTGCGNGSDVSKRTKNSTKSVEDVLNEGMNSSDEAVKVESPSSVNEIVKDDTQDEIVLTAADLYEEDPVEEELPVATPAPGVDVDLTVLSSTMVYSEVYNIVSLPEEYIGKVIKMEGIASTYIDEETGAIYYACIIQDATACCAQGIEYILSEDETLPYPEDGEIVTVIGVFDTYQEGEYTYCTLKDAKLVA